jgi:predicted DNA-binding transcriptional regulator AlpA
MKTDTLEVLMELKDVLRRTCLNEEALIFLIKANRFPAPLRNPQNGTVKWFSDEIDGWISSSSGSL